MNNSIVVWFLDSFIVVFLLCQLIIICLHTFSFTGQLLLAKGDVEQAFNAFKIVLDGDRDNVPALLGQVLSF